MTQKVFDLIDSINKDGIENGIWSLYDFHDESSKDFFGTEEDVRLNGKVVVVYVGKDDFLCWLKPETADMKFKMPDSSFEETLYIWKI